MINWNEIASDRINLLEPSATITLAKQVRELKESGKDIISLTLGEPDFDTPNHIKNAGVEAIRNDFTHYPPVPGYGELREAVAQHFDDVYKLDYLEADNIVISNGAKQSLYNVFQCLINPGDEVIIPAPYWVSYVSFVKLAGGHPVILKTSNESNLKITPSQLEAAISSKTKGFLFGTPSNPSGVMYTEEEIRALGEVIAKHEDMFVVADDIYGMLTFDEAHFSIGRIDALKDRTITINGLSKAFAMTGWRVGFMAAPVEVAKMCEKLQGQTTSGVCSIAQKAAYSAVSTNLSTVWRMQGEFQRRRDFLMDWVDEHLPALKYTKPEGAFYLFPDVTAYIGKKQPNETTIDDDLAFCQFLVDEAGVALVPGSAFGTDNHVRISFATDVDTLKRAMERIKVALKQLK